MNKRIIIGTGIIAVTGWALVTIQLIQAANYTSCRTDTGKCTTVYQPDPTPTTTPSTTPSSEPVPSNAPLATPQPSTAPVNSGSGCSE